VAYSASRQNKVEPPLQGENILNSYVALLRQMSNARTAVEEKALARELDLPSVSGCSSAFALWLGADSDVRSARNDGRFARA